MELLKETRFVERLRFFNGQRLFASDLQGLEALNRELRWLHNRSLHQAGIGSGFAVSGRKDEREVTIGPGYAIDAEGREIILTQSLVEPVPPNAGEPDGSPILYDLTVSYPEDVFLEETERREGICHQPGGTIRLKEEPVFCWIELNESGQPKSLAHKQEIKAGKRIRLARVEVLQCRLNKDLSIAQRLNARPPKQPYICCGRVRKPGWRPWMIIPFDPDQLLASMNSSSTHLLWTNSIFPPLILPIGLQADINTCHCGFSTHPCYSANISDGQRVMHFTLDEDSARGVGRTLTFLVDGLVQIVDPQPNQFTVQVLLIVQWLYFEPETPMETVNNMRGRSEQRPMSLAGALPNLIGKMKSMDIDQTISRLFSDWQLTWMGVEG
jgi:hypothetical protein